MVEVKITLLDPQEIAWFAQFTDALNQKRAGVVAQAAPAAPAASAPPAPSSDAVPSDIEMQRAITEYAQRPNVGVPGAKELLAQFGVNKVGEIPAERRAEFIAKVRA